MRALRQPDRKVPAHKVLLRVVGTTTIDKLVRDDLFTLPNSTFVHRLVSPVLKDQQGRILAVPYVVVVDVDKARGVVTDRVPEKGFLIYDALCPVDHVEVS